MTLRRALAVALALAILPTGCTRGKTEAEKAAARTEQAQRVTREPAGLDPNWRDGTLPPGLDEGTPVPGGTAVVRLYGEPPSLAYLVDSDGNTRRITLHNVIEALVKPDPRGHPDYPMVPELAESWEESEDHLVFTFHLRRGVKWHDGTPFTAKDVKFTFDRLMDPLVRAMHLRQAFVDLESVTTPDDRTVVLRWKKPYVWALRKIGDIGIYPAHAFEGYEGSKFNTAPFMRAPIGTGPFKFVSWEEKKQIVLERWEGYWGRKAYLDRVIWRSIDEPNVAWQLLLRGELDLDTSLTAEQYVNSASEPKLIERYHRVKYFESSFAWIGWNNERPIFRDARVRRALDMLLDREKLNTALYANVNVPANCVFYHLGKGCDPATRQAPFDPDGAAALLEEAGWRDSDGDGILDRDGVPFRFTIIIPSGNPVNEQMVLVYQQQLYRMGIQMDLQKIEWSIYVGKLRSHEFDACMLMWSSSEPESDPYEVWHSSQAAGGSNYVGYSDPEADAMAERIRSVFDAAERQRIYRAFNAKIVNDAPYNLLYHMPRRGLLSRRLRGVYLSPLQYFQFRDMWIDPAGGRP